MRSVALRYGAVLVLFSLTTGIFFHDVARHPQSRLACCIGDGTGTIRDLWVASVEHKTPFTITRDYYNGAPEGTARVPATIVANAGIQTALLWALRDVTGTVLAWNLYLLFGLVASGMAMFALLEVLGCRLIAALFGGYIFAFSPYAVEQADAGHIGFDQNWAIVLTALSMIWLRKRRSYGRSAIAGLSVALAFYISAYQGLFAGIVALSFLIVEFWRLPSKEDRIRSLALVTTTYGSAAIALLPVLDLYKRERSSVDTSAAHSLNDLYTFAARVTAYAVPSPGNPLFHWVRGFHPTDVFEQTLFIGYTTWVLAIVAVVLMFRRNAWLRASDTRWWTGITMAILTPLAFMLSLPPSYHIGPVLIPMPSSLLGLATAFWRVYARFGVVVSFGLAVLAALGISSLSVRADRRWRLLGPIALLLVVFELLPGNVGAVDMTAKPAWVAWLASHPHGIVAIYPMVIKPRPIPGLDDAGLWYQKLDHDPGFDMVGASFVQKITRQAAIRTLSRNLGDPLTPRILSTEGVRYVVVDEPVFHQQGLRVPRLDRRFFTPLMKADGVWIYSVHAPPVNITATIAANRHKINRLQGGLSRAEKT
ncbi:MAG TPA: hypothetical protein VH063_01760 [Gaiellaceae bacterium]|jgi:hypothetical protein|nr:hypothetical protein [Gaiellaceae bacterium]